MIVRGRAAIDAEAGDAWKGLPESDVHRLELRRLTCRAMLSTRGAGDVPRFGCCD